MVLTTTASATIPSGRLMKKIQRQDTLSVSVPPASGPATAAVAHIAPM
jgi:hypothetical protein